MRPVWHSIDRIKDEVARERLGWLSGSFVARQLKSMVLLVPAVAAIMLISDSTAKRAIVGVSLAFWFAWVLCTVAIGIFYLCRWADRAYDRRDRRLLSKDYQDS